MVGREDFSGPLDFMTCYIRQGSYHLAGFGIQPSLNVEGMFEVDYNVPIPDTGGGYDYDVPRVSGFVTDGVAFGIHNRTEQGRTRLTPIINGRRVSVEEIYRRVTGKPITAPASRPDAEKEERAIDELVEDYEEEWDWDGDDLGDFKFD